jgi:hypothetical protein
LIARQTLLETGSGEWRELAFAVVAVRRKAPAFACSDDQIVPTISINVCPGDARPQLAQFFRQQWLALKIIKWFLMVLVGDEMADVFEEW